MTMTTLEKPTKAFLSEIIQEEAEYQSKKKKKKEALEAIELNEVPIDLEDELEVALNKPSKEATKTSLKGQYFSHDYTDDPLYQILDAPPHYYLIKNIPDLLVPKFEGVKKIYFGAKMIRTQHMRSNMVAQPIVVHKLFLALLIEPPVYEDILASHKASVSESSFAFNLEEECYYRWFNNLPQLKSYYDLMNFCDQTGVHVLFNYNPQKLVMALENVKEA